VIRSRTWTSAAVECNLLPALTRPAPRSSIAAFGEDHHMGPHHEGWKRKTTPLAPTTEESDELIAFLPSPYSESAAPAVRWRGGRLLHLRNREPRPLASVRGRPGAVCPVRGSPAPLESAGSRSSSSATIPAAIRSAFRARTVRTLPDRPRPRRRRSWNGGGQS